jgi:hypothetical protein
VCFEKKDLKDPSDIVFSACVFMRYWAGIYSEEAQAMINAGVESMMRTVLLILRKQSVAPRRIEAGSSRFVEEEDDDQDGGTTGLEAIRD